MPNALGLKRKTTLIGESLMIIMSKLLYFLIVKSAFFPSSFEKRDENGQTNKYVSMVVRKIKWQLQSVLLKILLQIKAKHGPYDSISYLKDV